MRIEQNELGVRIMPTTREYAGIYDALTNVLTSDEPLTLGEKKTCAAIAMHPETPPYINTWHSRLEPLAHCLELGHTKLDDPATMAVIKGLASYLREKAKQLEQEFLTSLPDVVPEDIM